ncbi:MAG TPA: hypothetical protein VFY87_00220 [Geminicoccaceae bacterium]|nr:hypothetical protein [Geminicoccaceae bacterium]
MPSRVTASAMITCGWLAVASLLAVAAPAQRRIQLAAPGLGGLVGLVDLAIGRGGVVEDQVNVEPEQVGGPQEHVALDRLRPHREHVEGAIELVDREPARLRQPGHLGQPARRAGEFGAGRVQPLCRHGEQRRRVRGGEAGAGEAAADGGPDAEFLPQAAGGQHDAEVEDRVDLDLAETDLGGGSDAVAGLKHAVDAGDQALQSGGVELVGAAEAVEHPRLGAPGLGIPAVLGEGVVGDRGAVAVPPLGFPQVYA